MVGKSGNNEEWATCCGVAPGTGVRECSARHQQGSSKKTGLHLTVDSGTLSQLHKPSSALSFSALPKVSSRVMALPPTGRLAGIDYGEKRIGIAICDGDRMIASPLEIYHRRNDALDRAYFQRLVKDYDLVGIVVGLPVHASGEESVSSQQARRFGAWLNEVTGLPVAFIDERYTSAQADTLMAGIGFSRKQKKDRRDMLAAQVILATYLQSPHAADEPPAALEG